MKPSVVVTGASTGIGEACAEALAQRGFFVFGSVRREEDAARLRQRLGEDFTPLFFDVTDAGAVQRAALEVEARIGDRALAGLVNNAGAALPGPLLHQPIDEFRRQMEINLIGQLQTIQAFAPLLGAGALQSGARLGPPGRIVNMSSVAGSFASPYIGAYAASKHALEGLSNALRRELMIFGVDVIVIAPGVIRTPIWDKAEQVDPDRWGETAYAATTRQMQKWAVEEGRGGLPPARVAEAVLRALTEKRPPTRIPVVRNYIADWLLPRLSPTRLVDRLIAKQLGLLPQQSGRKEDI